jgi:hypothetical protein
LQTATPAAAEGLAERLAVAPEFLYEDDHHFFSGGANNSGYIHLLPGLG